MVAAGHEVAEASVCLQVGRGEPAVTNPPDSLLLCFVLELFGCRESLRSRSRGIPGFVYVFHVIVQGADGFCGHG